MESCGSGDPIEEWNESQPEPVVKNGLKAEPDLYRRSIQGGYWVVGIRITTRILGFVKTFIFANLLIVQDLGLLAVAVMLTEILGTFLETGFQQKLIQQKKGIREYLDTAWTVNILRGLLMFLILFFVAPLAASLKVPPEKAALTVGIIRGIGLCIFLGSFGNIGVLYFRKNLDFKKVSLLQIPPVIVDITVSICVIIFYNTLWGFVIGRLCAVLAGTLLSYVLSSYRPRLSLDRQKVRELWAFGKWIFGLAVLNFLLNEGDDFFVWGYLGVSSLALYRYAFHFSNMPATEVTNTFSQVFFPAFSKIQDDLPRLREAYLKALTITAFFSFPIAGLIFVLGPDFVRLFLKADLHPMIPTLQILAFKGLFRSLGASRGPLFLALGRPKMQWIFHCIRLFVLAVLIYPLTKTWGIAGTAMATVLIAVLVNPLGFILSCRWLACSPWRMIKPCVNPLLSILLAGGGLAGIKAAVSFQVSAGMFFGLLGVGMISYLGLIFLFDSMDQYRICRILKENVSVFRKQNQRRQHDG